MALFFHIDEQGILGVVTLRNQQLGFMLQLLALATRIGYASRGICQPDLVVTLGYHPTVGMRIHFTIAISLTSAIAREDNLGALSPDDRGSVIANNLTYTLGSHPGGEDKFAQSLNTDGTMQVVLVNLIDKD